MKFYNRVKFTTSTTGTGTLTVGSASSGFRTPAQAGIPNATVVRYVIEDGSAWETGYGTYTVSGTTLSRNVLQSSNSDALINLSGSAIVRITALAEDILVPINELTEKTSLHNDDLFVIEDSEASNAKKKVKRSNVAANGAALASDKKVLSSGDKTTTSTTFGDIDTNLNITLTTGARRCLITFVASGKNSGAGNTVVDVEIDGARVGQTYGLIVADSTNNKDFSFSFITDVLSAGSHTFKPQFRVDGGTGTLYASTGVSPIIFTVQELPNQQGSGLRNYILIRDEKTQNTGGGTFTSGAWQTRTLNTEVSDAGGHASISSNQITLEAGTYEVKIRCPAWQVNRHQARLYNITDSAVTLLGTSEFAGVPASDTGGVGSSVIAGRFTITGSKVFEVQHQCQTTRSTIGWGIEANFTTEIYTVAEFWKVG